MGTKDVNVFSKIGKAATEVANKSKELAGQTQQSIVNIIGKNGDGQIDRSANLIQKKTYKFQCSHSLGIKEAIAGQIDGVLSTLKCGGNATVSEETRKEGRTTLEYYIEF